MLDDSLVVWFGFSKWYKGFIGELSHLHATAQFFLVNSRVSA